MNNGLLGWPVGPTKAQGLLGWPLGRLLAKQEMRTAGDTDGVVVTASASANQKGSWVTLTDGLEINATGFLIGVTQGTLSRDFLIDIAIGSPGSEVVIVENLQVSIGSVANAGHPNVVLPLPIPARTRIAARVQASTGAATIGLNLHLYNALQMPSSRFAKTYGANTADSGGTQVDPGGVTANQKGAWSELVAAVECPINFLVVSIGNQANAARSNASYVADIGVGAAGSEVAVVSSLGAASSVGSDILTPQWWGVPVSIPSGQRLVARAASSITAANRLFDVAVVGFG